MASISRAFSSSGVSDWASTVLASAWPLAAITLACASVSATSRRVSASVLARPCSMAARSAACLASSLALICDCRLASRAMFRTFTASTTMPKGASFSRTAASASAATFSRDEA